jgi:hypothetical protein
MVQDAGNGTTRPLMVGDRFAGFEVVSFSGDSLTVKIPAGKQVIVKVGAKQDFVVGD